MAIVTSGSLLFAPRVHADETSKAAALRRFDEGRALFEQNQFEKALEAFTTSLELLPSPNTRLYVARCHRALKHVGSAYTNFRLASREASDRLNATGEQRYRATVQAADAEAAEIASRVPHLTIEVRDPLPANASVKLDGNELGRTAWNSALELDPGNHVVSASAHRYAPFQANIAIAEAEQKSVRVVLDRLPTALLSLDFKTKPAGASVAIDGRPLDPARVEAPQELDPGVHTVTVRAPGYRDFDWRRALGNGSNTRVDVQMQASASAKAAGGTPKWLFFSVAGASVVALGASAYFAIDATSRSSTEKDKDPLNRDPNEKDKIKSESTTANILFVGGAALAVGAGVLAFTTEWSSGGSGARVGLTPVLTRSAGGAALTGRF